METTTSNNPFSLTGSDFGVELIGIAWPLRQAYRFLVGGLWLIEKQFQMASQVVDALGRDRSSVCGLGQDERALDGSLRVERGAFHCPVGMHIPLAHRFLNVENEDYAVAAYHDNRLV